MKIHHMSSYIIISCLKESCKSLSGFVIKNKPSPSTLYLGCQSVAVLHLGQLVSNRKKYLCEALNTSLCLCCRGVFANACAGWAHETTSEQTFFSTSTPMDPWQAENPADNHHMQICKFWWILSLRDLGLKPDQRMLFLRSLRAGHGKQHWQSHFCRQLQWPEKDSVNLWRDCSQHN